MKKTKKQAQKAEKRAASMRAAAAMLGVPGGWVSKAKADGVSAFTANGQVLLEPLRRWIEAHWAELEAEGESLKDQKLREQIQRLRRENDREAAGLVSRSWIHERFQRILGEAWAIREKALEEHPHRFKEAAGDIAHCRAVYRGVWDSILTDLQKLSKHMAEPPKV